MPSATCLLVADEQRGAEFGFQMVIAAEIEGCEMKQRFRRRRQVALLNTAAKKRSSRIP